jgi:hypothetical protein
MLAGVARIPVKYITLIRMRLEARGRECYRAILEPNKMLGVFMVLRFRVGGIHDIG